MADGLKQARMAQPAIIEAYNVEKTTAASLARGQEGQGTRVGNLLADTVSVLGGIVTRWEPIRDGSSWHLRVHVSYP